MLLKGFHIWYLLQMKPFCLSVAMTVQRSTLAGLACLASVDPARGTETVQVSPDNTELCGTDTSITSP